MGRIAESVGQEVSSLGGNPLLVFSEISQELLHGSGF